MFYCISQILLSLLIAVVFVVVVLAALGKSLGFREKFVDCLVNLFEWAATQEHSVGYGRLDYECDESSSEGYEENDASEEMSDRDLLLNSKGNDRSKATRVPRRSPVRAAKLPHQRRDSSNSSGIIKREKTKSIESKLSNLGDIEKTSIVGVIVDDTFDFITAGIESIIEDQVTSRFKAEELASWNLLTRTSYGYQHINGKMTALWVIGFFIRYLILVPIRMVLFMVGLSSMIIITALLGYIPDKRENRAKQGGICVANHTSPIDVMILSCDNCYAMVGQRQPGFLGFLQTTVNRSSDHIWFERSEATDRKQVSKRLQEHADDVNKLPMIIFPEGTCINNTSVMMFKKGSFEIASTIYPIAMKYDSRLGDAFWNSSEQSYGEYLFRMMTSWAIICDVWYLPAMSRNEGEDAVAFARRVKRAIAQKGGLVDLEWDGGLKRAKVPPKLIAQHQKMYWERLSRKTSINAETLEEAAKLTADIIANETLREALKEEEEVMKHGKEQVEDREQRVRLRKTPEMVNNTEKDFSAEDFCDKFAINENDLKQCSTSTIEKVQ
ncbi:unnamed protein product [Anisakis simplex]|uniref:PlsC domain-containing protein n=1 Tax=Anisakis simplex TaxID=6269 RepID=A0A0M3JVP5_ANISI|nr:unnamed protein product [Anisakis simplex]